MRNDIGVQSAAGRSHDVGRIFQALADPTRRAVVERLARGPASTTELARPFNMALPSFAQHLVMLEKCGVVRSSKEGRVRRFHLAPEPLESAEDWMSAQRAIWNLRLDQLQDFVENMQPPDR